MSSTYTSNAMNEDPLEWTNKEWSACDCMNPSCKMVVESLAFHCLEACFKP